MKRITFYKCIIEILFTLKEQNFKYLLLSLTLKYFLKIGCEFAII
jgi:hypothetical protein